MHNLDKLLNRWIALGKNDYLGKKYLQQLGYYGAFRMGDVLLGMSDDQFLSVVEAFGALPKNICPHPPFDKVTYTGWSHPPYGVSYRNMDIVEKDAVMDTGFFFYLCTQDKGIQEKFFNVMIYLLKEGQISLVVELDLSVRNNEGNPGTYHKLLLDSSAEEIAKRMQEWAQTRRLQEEKSAKFFKEIAEANRSNRVSPNKYLLNENTNGSCTGCTIS